MTLTATFKSTCDLCEKSQELSKKDLPAGWRICWLNFGLAPSERRWASEEYLVCDTCRPKNGPGLFRRLYCRIAGNRAVP